MSSATDVLQSASGRWPRLYVRLMHLKYRNKRYRRRVVTPSTHVVIEGFPTLGHELCHPCLQQCAAAGNRVVASHAHHGAHVQRAAALGIPTLVVVRHPSQCIPWRCALREEGRQDDPGLPELSINGALKKYATFDNDVVKVQDSIVVVRFEDVIKDYGLVICAPQPAFQDRLSRSSSTREDHVARASRRPGLTCRRVRIAVRTTSEAKSCITPRTPVFDSKPRAPTSGLSSWPIVMQGRPHDVPGRVGEEFS